MIVSGRVWKFGDDIDTDGIMPGAYSTLPYEEAVEFVMSGVAPGFSAKINEGDILVAGRNFGIGSSRESAPQGLKYAGISVVISASFGRIFFRNAINIGLPVIAYVDIEQLSDNDLIEVDLDTGIIHNMTKEIVLQADPLPAHLLSYIKAGGLVPYLMTQAKS
jgi:3-isopropylmalate/(R)-2-methylmalate dehydratase small subunit